MSRILIVDDNDSNQHYLRSVLQIRGHAVSAAANGAEALAAAQHETPDLVISDLLMPVMDGYSLLRAWRRDPALGEIPFIVLTATFTEADDERLARELGADDYICKPCEAAPLLARIDAVLQGAVTRTAPSASPEADDGAVFRLYSKALVRKLEQKSQQLEQANLRLQQDMAARQRAEQALADANGRLSERVKELEALFRAAELLSRDDRAPQQLLQEFSQLLPPAMRHSEQACGCAGWGESMSSTRADCSRTDLIRHEFTTSDGRSGFVQVCYTPGTSAALQFLPEERQTVRALAELLRGYLDRFISRQALQRTQDALRRSLVALAARNQELQDFAFVASHDLQEPLRKIRAFADILHSRHAADLPARTADYLARIDHAAGRMQTLIDDLLEYSRIATRDARQLPVDLQAVCREVLVDLEERVQSTGARVECGTLPVIQADPLQMRQLLQNLLSNALKFKHPDRPPLIQVSASTRADAEPEMIEITVSDNGIGFEQRFAERIFQPMQRLHGRNEYEGSGIGLAIVQRIVERHHGRITATGEPDKGAVFRIHLPLAKSAG